MRKISVYLLLFIVLLAGNAISQSMADSRPMNVGEIVTRFSPWGTNDGNGRGWHLTWNVDEQSSWEAWVPPGGTQDIGYHGVTKLGGTRHPSHGSMISYWYSVKNWTSPKSWIYPNSLYKKSKTYETFVVANGCKYSPVGKYNVPLMKPERILNFDPPIISIDGVQISNGTWKTTDQVDEVDYDQNQTEAVELSWTESIGITINQKWYQYSNHDYDDFVICDMKIINNGKTNGDGSSKYKKNNQILESFWFGIGIEFDPALDNYAEGNGRDDQIIEYYGDSAGDSLRVMCFYDGDSDEITGNDQFDPRGGPDAANDFPTGEYTAPYFCGVGILHADNSTDDTSDNPDQPVTTRWKKFEEWLDPIQAGKDAVDGAFNFLTGMDINPTGGYHQPNPTGYTAAANARNAGMLGFGPYTIGWEDTVHLVFALGVGSINEARAIELGWRVRNEGYDAETARKEVYDKGKANLFKTMSYAKKAHKNNFQVQSPPIAPDIYVDKGPQSNYIKWNAVDGAVKYRVYAVEGGIYHHQIYTQVFEGADPEFVHEDLGRGISYYYYVTAIDENGLESSHAHNRSGNPAIPFKRGIKTLDSLLVVPNPFNVNGGQYSSAFPAGETGYNFSGGHREQNQILFVNLPEVCTIRIFTSTGDLIKTLEHTDGSADEIWDPSITDYNQYPASGVYFFTVEATAPASVAGAVGQGKFIIIR